MALAALVAPVVAPSLAHAADAGELAGEPLTIDVTNTAIGVYHFDNRNTQGANPKTRVDDRYGELLDRLNVQLGWYRFRLGVRLDAVTYFNTPTPEEAQKLAVEDQLKRGQQPTDAYANRYYRELNTRFQSGIYPSKLYLDYTQPGLTVTVGDFYAQLGRGLVFSVRKIDELAIDTTVRGAKVVADHDFGGFSLAATAFAGQMNPLRVDEQTGRQLSGAGSPLFFGFPKAQDFEYYNPDASGKPVLTTDKARPSYLEDTVIGGRLEAGPDLVKFGANAAVLLRKSYAEENLRCVEACGSSAQCISDCSAQYPEFSTTSASRAHNQIRTLSGSVSFPSIAKAADVYVEVAKQDLVKGRATAIDPSGHVTDRHPDLSGYAIYANANVRKGPVTLSLEGKHYKSFFPLSANIDSVTPGFAAPEFDVLAYNQPPTAEPVYVTQLGQANVCITGGRGRLDVRFAKDVLVYGWLGRYTSFSEIAANNDCERKSELQTNTWDGAVGSELVFERGRSHVFAWVGARTTDREVASDANAAGLTDTFYREGYLRYDLVKHLAGPFSLQLQGFHRHRYEPPGFSEPWNEGENYTALQWSPHLAAIVGYEYMGRQGCRPTEPGEDEVRLCHYVNGGLQWRSANSERVLGQIFDTVSLFVGQRRGAIRCVSGVCRQFPPFEGARLELVSRF